MNDDPMAEYKQLGFVRSPKDVNTLHMFFSPSRVPTGLLREEIHLCIKLLLIMEKQKLAHDQKHGKWVMGPELRKMLIRARIVLEDLNAGRKTPNIDHLVEEIDAKLPPAVDVAIQLPAMTFNVLPSELTSSLPMTRAR